MSTAELSIPASDDSYSDEDELADLMDDVQCLIGQLLERPQPQYLQKQMRSVLVRLSRHQDEAWVH